MKNAFSLAEVLITVAIIGILAAIVLPEFQSNTDDAKAAAAKDNLRILRNAIELYTVQHNDVPPGYPNGDTSQLPIATLFINQLRMATNTHHQYAFPGTAGFTLGPYLKGFPANPFNGKKSVVMVIDESRWTPTCENGWLYEPSSRKIRVDWAGTDKTGQDYSDY